MSDDSSIASKGFERGQTGAVTRMSMADDLRALGLRFGDTVIVHSSLAAIGRVAGGARAVVEAFLDVLGSEGTLVVPTFGKLGIIPDTVKTWPGAIESIHPLASVAAIGLQAEMICRDHWKAELAHGPDTPYMRIAETGGYICLLGVDQDRNTSLHTVEELLRLPYLKTSAEKTFETPEGGITKSWPFFPGPHRDFIGLDKAFRQSGKMRVGRVGRAVARIIKSQDLIDISMELGRRNPAFVLCDNPNCAACVRQRADLRRACLKSEDFHFASAASLAGRHAPEIVENCIKSGVDAVELDVFKGKPVELAKADELKRFVEELRDGGLCVTALRIRSICSDWNKLFETARAVEIQRVVLPLDQRAAMLSAKAAEYGISLSFYNLALDSGMAAEMFMQARVSGGESGFAFSAAEFARSGESPFLVSYKKKFRRFVDQLDVEDCLYDGAPAPLAMGNAEIKEMISILRCAGFAGWMVLGRRNKMAGTLAEAVDRFMRLLENM